MKREQENVIKFPDSFGNKVRRLSSMLIDDTQLQQAEFTDTNTDVPTYMRTSTEILHDDGLPSHVRVVEIGELAVNNITIFDKSRK